MDGGRTESSTGWRPVSGLPVGDAMAIERGEADTAARWIVADRPTGTRSAFVKVGATSITADWIPTGHRNDGSLRGWFLLEVWVAGFFCARAGDPPIPDAPHVRPLQIRQATTALPWAARALGLPEPIAG